MKNIIIGYQYENTDEFLEFMDIAIENKINIIVVKNGDFVQIDKYTYFEILSPFKDEMITENATNNNSLVAKLHFFDENNDFNILFTGDIEKIAEEKLVSVYGENLKTDILKVAHHGSKTSTTEEFLNLVRPKIALIGVGENNSYGHPASDTIQKLQNMGTSIFRTDECGEIDILIKNGNIKINKFIN